jgi:hypothetical protein
MKQEQVLLEAWKQTVSVQSHFNDIAMKIRGFGLTLISAIITAYGVTKAGQNSTVMWSVLVIWFAFYLMDRWWYHYLLLGAVLHGRALELQAKKKFKLVLPRNKKIKKDKERSMLGLADRISDLNQEAFGLNAKYKIDIYYGLVAIALTVVILAN